MDTHEYQAKKILQKYGIPTPPFRVISSLEKVQMALSELEISEAVIKIQVHAGGRGKAGGVKIAKNKEDVHKLTKELLGMRLVNNQTGSAGIIANCVLITKTVDIEKEYYLAAVIDRKKAQGMLIASPEGGVNIEEVAAEFPEKILKIPVGLNGKIRSYHLLELIKFMGWTGKVAKAGIELTSRLAQAFVETDASLFEINPLVLTKNGELLALDAKLSIDDNALFRQNEIASFYDPSQLPLSEVEAHNNNLAFVALEGEIGCMVNGAGLAMATMDMIHKYGARAANFLDVGGSATKERVAEGFKILLSDPKVRAILVNIFGGIMNCATIAEGIIAAAKDLEIKVPLVVRMEGTNVEEGRRLLAASGLNIGIANNLSEAADAVSQWRF